MGKESGYITTALVIALLMSLALQAILSMRQKSVTYDELSYLPAGYSYLRTHDFRLNIEHPPLIKILAAFPLLFMDLKIPLEHHGWKKGDKWLFGRDFLFYANSNTDQIIFQGRIPIVILSLILGIFIFYWARELSGPAGGILALVLYAFCPNIIAHSRLITTDLGVGCFMLIAVYSLWKYLQSPSPKGLIIAGLTLGLALVSKFLALVLIPVYPLLIFLMIKDKAGALDKKTFRCMAQQIIFTMGIILSLSIVVIYLSYGSLSASYLYIKGIVSTYADHDPRYEYFLWGNYSHVGWWYYYFAAFFLKTTVPVMIFIGVSGMLWLKDYRDKNLYFLLLPVIVLFWTTMFDTANIGLRRILPVYPFLFILISKAAVIARERPWGLVTVGVLCLWHISSSVRIYPDYLTYFNGLVGGPAKGIYYLDDSNIDWGQDLKRLKEFTERNNIGPIKIHCFNSVQPEDYGIKYQKIGPQDIINPRKGYYYAISAHILQRKDLYRSASGEKTLRYDWLKKYRPVHNIGHSIYIFKF